MRHRLKIPARINILGNPGDATEGDFAVISAAIDIWAYAEVAPAEDIILQLGGGEHSPTLVCSPDDLPLPYDGPLDLMKGALNRLYHFSPEIRQRLHNEGVHLTIWSQVPRGSGLGGSSLIVLLTLAGLRARYQLHADIHNDYLLAELTQRVEEQELGITCGFADRYVPLFGGLAYLDFRGKLHHKEIYQEPLVTYERLDAWADALHFVLVSSGVERHSGAVHARLRARYLQENQNWQQREKPPPMVDLMTRVWETAWRGKIALLQRDMATFGQLMNTNHRLVNEMMTCCGFADGAGWANNLFIESALAQGALGAKLTGAGGGGSVFALVRPGEEERLIQEWKRVAQEHDLKNAKMYQPLISPQGLVVDTLDDDPT
jgi:D-glycero-alpha-D-manno-heptose-7-phosphate kinase